MQRGRKLYWAKVAVVIGAFAIVLWAHEYGPDPGVCGVPGENGTCTQSGCHSGTTNNPANKGSLAIGFPNGLRAPQPAAAVVVVARSDDEDRYGCVMELFSTF